MIRSPIALRAGARRAALERLGYSGVVDAKARLTQLARSGMMPWCNPEFKETLRYISPRDLVLLPSWHLWCRGILRDLFVTALTTPLKDVPANHPFIFSGAERTKVSVRCPHATPPLPVARADLSMFMRRAPRAMRTAPPLTVLSCLLSRAAALLPIVPAAWAPCVPRRRSRHRRPSTSTVPPPC